MCCASLCLSTHFCCCLCLSLVLCCAQDVSRVDIRSIVSHAPAFVSVGVLPAPADPSEDIGGCCWGLPTDSDTVDTQSMQDTSAAKNGSHLIVLKHLWIDAAHFATGVAQYLDLVKSVAEPRITRVSILSKEPAEVDALTAAGWAKKGEGIEVDGMEGQFAWFQIKIQ